MHGKLTTKYTMDKQRLPTGEYGWMAKKPREKDSGYAQRNIFTSGRMHVDYKRNRRSMRRNRTVIQTIKCM